MEGETRGILGRLWQYAVQWWKGRRSLTDLPVERIAATLATTKGLIEHGARALKADVQIDNLEIPQGLKTQLKMLAQTELATVGKVKEVTEAWVAEFMSEVETWSKRRAQAYSLLIGVLVALALNVDTIAIAQSLADDPAKRAAVVELAETVNKDGGVKNCPIPDLSDAEKKALTVEQKADLDKLNKPVDPEDLEAAASSVSDCLTAIETVYPFPIGWNTQVDFDGTKPVESIGKAIGAIWSKLDPTKLLGLLLTGLALSLGSRFWFDLLSNLLALRAAGKANRASTSAD